MEEFADEVLSSSLEEIIEWFTQNPEEFARFVEDDPETSPNNSESEAAQSPNGEMDTTADDTKDNADDSNTSAAPTAAEEHKDTTVVENNLTYGSYDIPDEDEGSPLYMNNAVRRRWKTTRRNNSMAKHGLVSQDGGYEGDDEESNYPPPRPESLSNALSSESDHESTCTSGSNLSPSGLFSFPSNPLGGAVKMARSGRLSDEMGHKVLEYNVKWNEAMHALYEVQMMLRSSSAAWKHQQ
ncbi:hypothetical protein BO70DRAFT_354361 [Aspergillus heteromorphus CBS 117.55]|uniref:Uncharacterized protein n=1 Tax=Aspergillus heteromorphus CBS 117.55 TaxID=1448321 RepID=A0A317VR91_9EURO|nr:uncharacterized protein BO70DRAFT_354361 [Aspergillus heteromorphus CBS 117.55]PWY75418.1 hypothetical protein BO70DRAFT_354361 [Aspergillus heteromorphus CBS 117.55]